MRLYYTICLYFTLTTTRVYEFYFNVLYLHVFLFKNFNINFRLYNILYETILHHISILYLYLHVFISKNFNINYKLYLIYTGSYHIIYLYFIITMTCAYQLYLIKSIIYLNIKINHYI